MIQNYFKVAFRNLWKNRRYAAINIFGLAFGLATCLLICLYVLDELGYDRYNTKADRIYRVDGDILFGGNRFILAVAPDPMGATMVQDYPEIESMVRFRGYGGITVKKGNENLQEDRVIYADSTLFDVFTLPLVAGNPHDALKDPKSVVITEAMAEKYFSRKDVVGETLLINGINPQSPFKISGVMKNMPEQSHFKFDFFFPLSMSDESRQNNWVSNNFNTYVVLRPGTNPTTVEAKFDGMLRKYMAPQVKEILNTTFEEFEKTGNYAKYTLMPVKNIHLYSNKVAELGANGSIQYVYIFSAVAILILLIACVNFMNLSTARSSNRAKEVGVRKVLGSMRKDLIMQFLTESVLVSFISLLIAVLAAWALLPYFNSLAAKSITLSPANALAFIPISLLIVLFVGLLAGSYPAFYLSSFIPIQVLKGRLAGGFKSGSLRSVLVVGQFFISIFLIVGTVVIYKQLNFIQNKKLGYTREQVLVLHNIYPLDKSSKTFMQDLLNIPGIEKATMTGYLPTGQYRSDNPFFQDPTLDQKKAVSMQSWSVDENYVPTLGMQIVQGRNFSKDFLTDSSAVIVNEAAAKMIGTEDLIGKKLYTLKDINKKDLITLTIVGVVKDFNFNSLREQITPMALLLREERGAIAMRISTKDVSGIVNAVEKKWRSVAPGQPFSYSFMDDDFNATYNTEQRIGKIAVSFAILAILIACLGLLGLATFAAEQRTKEIGIRKVLGASVSNITQMMSKDFLKLVIIAAVIAFPLSWWAMNYWLQDFAYRVGISWWIFVVAGAVALLIALATVSFQAIKAALANPVKSLRTE